MDTQSPNTIKSTLRRYIATFEKEHDITQWFDPLTIMFDEPKKCINIAFPHHFFSTWFIEKKKEIFIKYVKHLFPEITFIFSSFQYENNISNSESDFLNQSIKEDTSSIYFDSKKDTLKHFTFENFIFNKKNDFPIVAVKQATYIPFPEGFFPLTLYGRSGSGKTHLLCAMANNLRVSIKDVFYGTVQDIDKFATCVNKNALQAFFIDDIQKMYKNSILQNKFLQFFDTINTKKTLFAISIDSHPSKCSWLYDTLCMRLNQGIVIELKKPDLDVRHRYIKHKNKQLNLGLDKNNILLIARNFEDFRLIDGMINKIKTYQSLVPNKHGDIIEIINKTGSQTSLNHDSIIQRVAEFYSLTKDDLIGKKRSKNISIARQIAMHICRELLGISLEQIGNIFSGRDHSSVLYAINKVNKLKVTNKDMNNQLSKLKKMCLF